MTPVPVISHWLPWSRENLGQTALILGGAVGGDPGRTAAGWFGFRFSTQNSTTLVRPQLAAIDASSALLIVDSAPSLEHVPLGSDSRPPDVVGCFIAHRRAGGSCRRHHQHHGCGWPRQVAAVRPAGPTDQRHMDIEDR